MKVICIKELTAKELLISSCVPIYFGRIYEIEEIVEGKRGTGYILAGVDNSHIQVVSSNGIPIPNAKFSYHSSRFLPLSEIDEKDILSERVSDELAM